MNEVSRTLSATNKELFGSTDTKSTIYKEMLSEKNNQEKRFYLTKATNM